MAVYPVRVPRHSYRGRNETKRWHANEYNRAAGRLEHFINDKVEDLSEGACRSFMYATIARETGLDVELVHRVLGRIEAGHNGLTVWKRAEPT